MTLRLDAAEASGSAKGHRVGARRGRAIGATTVYRSGTQVPPRRLRSRDRLRQAGSSGQDREPVVAERPAGVVGDLPEVPVGVGEVAGVPPQSARAPP